jgi:hypothetical protein
MSENPVEINLEKNGKVIQHLGKYPALGLDISWRVE